MKKTYAILLKNIRKLNKWRDIPYFRIIKLNVGRSSPLIYIFNETLTKILARLFLQARYKYFIKEQRAKNSQNILKNKVKELLYQIFKIQQQFKMMWKRLKEID